MGGSILRHITKFFVVAFVVTLFLITGQCALAQAGPQLDKANEGKTNTKDNGDNTTTTTEVGKIESSGGKESQTIKETKKDKDGNVIEETDIIKHKERHP